MEKFLIVFKKQNNPVKLSNNSYICLSVLVCEENIIEMSQIITAKLKLQLSPTEKSELDKFCFAYRDGLNYASKIAFENKKTSNVHGIQKLTYEALRGKYKLPAQASCSVCRQVGATYKGLWTKLKQNIEQKKQGYTKKRYKGLDQAPKFVSRTATLQYGKDFSFKKEQTVSVQTLDGRIKVRYTGFNRHLDFIKNETTRIGGAKFYYCKTKKQYYILVSIEVETPQIEIEKLSRVKGADVGQRNLAVTQDNQDNARFYNGGQTLHKANKYSILIKQLQKKGTRSATRKLVLLSGKERRFKMQVNHAIAKQVVEPNTIIGLENLTHIRERTANKRRKGKKASVKQRKENSNNSKWAFAELHGFIDYKANMIGSLAIMVDADYTSQMCIKCGHTSRDNRKNGSVIFKCVCCGYEVHSDLLGSRNVLIRTILVRQDLIGKGALVNKPNVSNVESKAERLKRFSELRWSSDTSHNSLDCGS